MICDTNYQDDDHNCRQPPSDPRSRRAREQPQGRQHRDPEAPADGVHRRLRLGQELAGVRHDRRGVAAADQRDLQRLRAGLHADPGAAGGRPAGGLTTAIIVDQERMGANSRSTVGTATDANAMLRIVFSRLGEPSAGPSFHYSFNLPAGACPRCEGMGNVTDIDLTQLYDGSRSIAEGAITIPGYTVDGWMVRIFAASGFLDPDKPIRDYTETELHDFLHREPTKVKVESINMTYEGLVPRVQKSFLSKDREALQPHIRAFVDRAVTFTACPECGGSRLNEAARSSRIDGINIADACAMQISDLAEWVRGLDEPSVAPLLATLRHTLDSFVEIGLGYLSLDRPSGTLSGGEAQRTKMIRHLGSALTDVTYVFDEPTVGLHPHDVQRMNDLLLRLRDKGNTVLVVEHEPEVIEVA